MTTYMDLVKAASAALTSRIEKQIETGDDDSVPMTDWVCWRKVRKHLDRGSQRDAAKYVKLRLSEDPTPLSEWLKGKLRTTPLKATKDPGQVLFTSESGEPRAFGFVRATA